MTHSKLVFVLRIHLPAPREECYLHLSGLISQPIVAWRSKWGYLVDELFRAGISSKGAVALSR